MTVIATADVGAQIHTAGGEARALAERALQLYESDPNQADVLARQVLEATADGHDDVAHALALQAAGMAAWERQALDEATELLQRSILVATATGSGTVAARARSFLAVVLAWRGDDEGALAAAAAAEPQLTGRLRAELQHHMASVLERLGRLPEAYELSTRALNAFRRAGDVLWQAKGLNNRAIILGQLGDLSGAERQLDQADDKYRQLAMPLGLLKVRNNRAWLASLRGDVPRALGLLDGLQQEFAEHGVPPGLLHLERAGVLLAASLFTEALTAARRAAADLDREGMPLDRAEAQLLASIAARLAGSFEVAEELAADAAAAFEGQRRQAWLLRARHAQIENAWASGHHDIGTESLATDTARALEAAGWRHWARQVHLLAGRMALTRGDIATAERHLVAARAGRRTATDTADEAALRARLLFAQDDAAAAQRVIRSGLRAIEAQEALLGATELRVRGAGRAAELADLGLAWAVRSGRPASILVWAERRRAVSLRVPPVRPPRDEELAQLLAEHRVATAAIEQLEQTSFHAGPDPAAYQRLALLDARIRTLTRATPGRPAVTTTFERVTSAALAAALDGRALVELVAVDRRLGAVIVTGHRLRWQPLGSLDDVLDELCYTRFEMARAMVPGTRRDGSAALDASLERLDELIGTTIAAAVGGREVVIAPVAALHTLPWGSLPSMRGRPVTVSPSATTWWQATTRAHRPAGPVVVVAGPDLQHAEREAMQVASIAGAATTLLGDDANARAVTRAIDGASVVHLACHGRHHPDSPLFSSLRLVDGSLTVYELEGIRRAPELVVLSACDSAVAAESVGDELIGLTATLLALGARTLIGATSPVSDASAVPLMVAFHRQRAAGATPAQALADARTQVDPTDRAARATAVAFGCFGAGR